MVGSCQGTCTPLVRCCGWFGPCCKADQNPLACASLAPTRFPQSCLLPLWWNGCMSPRAGLSQRGWTLLLSSFLGTEAIACFFFFPPQSAPLGGTAVTARGHASAGTGACVTLPQGCATARPATSAPTAASVSARVRGGGGRRWCLGRRCRVVGANPAPSRVADPAGDEKHYGARLLHRPLKWKNCSVSHCTGCAVGSALPTWERRLACVRPAFPWEGSRRWSRLLSVLTTDKFSCSICLTPK